MTENSVPITATMNKDVAYQLAQFCKRVSFSACFDLTEAHLSEDERTKKAYQMIAGLDAVAAGLEKEGFAPR